MTRRLIMSLIQKKCEKNQLKKKSRQIEMGQKKDWTYKIDRSDQTVDHVTFGEKTRKNMSLKVRKSQNIFFLSSIPPYNQWKKFKLPNWLNKKKQFIMLNSSQLRKFNHCLEKRAEIREKIVIFLEYLIKKSSEISWPKQLHGGTKNWLNWRL